MFEEIPAFDISFAKVKPSSGHETLSRHIDEMNVGTLLTAASFAPKMLRVSARISWDCSPPGDGVQRPVTVTATPVDNLSEQHQYTR